MKTILIAAFVTISISSCAQQAQNSKVPSVVQNALLAKFSNANNPDWDKKRNFYEAEFMMDSLEYTVQIDPSGKLMQYKVEMQLSQLPANIVSLITRDHPGYEIDDVEKLEKDGITYYQVELEAKGRKDKHLIFSGDGKPATGITYID